MPTAYKECTCTANTAAMKTIQILVIVISLLVYLNYKPKKNVILRTIIHHLVFQTCQSGLSFSDAIGLWVWI